MTTRTNPTMKKAETPKNHLEDPRCFKVYFQTKALMEEVRRTGDASPLFYEGRR
jgi:hypothetical protein